MAGKKTKAAAPDAAMYALSQPKRRASHSSANILPCKVHHDGKVNASRRYWNPHKGADDLCTSHFRGRRLKGKSLELPAGYRGVVVKPSAKTVEDGSLKAEAIDEFERTTVDTEPATRRAEEERLQDAVRHGQFDTGELHVMDEISELDDVVVWGHDELQESTADAYSKGVEEWIALAEAVHKTGPPELTQE